MRNLYIKKPLYIFIAAGIISCNVATEPSSVLLKDYGGADTSLASLLDSKPATLIYAWAPWCKPCVNTIQQRMSGVKSICDSMNVQLVCIAFIEDTADGFVEQNKKLKELGIASFYYRIEGWHWNTRQVINDVFGVELQNYVSSSGVPAILLVNNQGEVLSQKVPIYTKESLLKALEWKVPEG